MSALLAPLLALRMLHPEVFELTPEAVELGAAVLAAEANTAPTDFAPIAAVIANRVIDRRRFRRRRGNPWVGVMRAPKQFASPAFDRVEPHHRLQFVLGALWRPGWRGRALLFATEQAVERHNLRLTWGNQFEEIVDTGTVHVFFGD